MKKAHQLFNVEQCGTKKQMTEVQFWKEEFLSGYNTPRSTLPMKNREKYVADALNLA